MLLPGRLPLEELLFFLVVPVCAILGFEAVRAVARAGRAGRRGSDVHRGRGRSGCSPALVVDLFVLRTRLLAGGVFWATYPIIVGFQLLSNGILTGRGIVRYDPAAIIGLRIVYAPVEDLPSGSRWCCSSLSVWVRLNR